MTAPAPDGAPLYLNVNALTDKQVHELFVATRVSWGDSVGQLRHALDLLAQEQAALARPVAAPRAPSEEIQGVIVGLETLAKQDRYYGATGETCTKAANLLRAALAGAAPAPPEPT